MNHKNRVAGHGSWNPQKNCWQFTDLYWEPGFIFDTEWLDDDCYISRVEMCLWNQMSCYEKARDGSLVLIERTREKQRSYVLAEQYCKDGLYQTWTEDYDSSDHQRQRWDIESEFWQDLD